MIVVYTIKTPNQLYNGVTEGVQFSNGTAEVSDVNKRNVLVNNYGYIDATPAKKKQTEDKPKPRRTSSAK